MKFVNLLLLAPALMLFVRFLPGARTAEGGVFSPKDLRAGWILYFSHLAGIKQMLRAAQAEPQAQLCLHPPSWSCWAGLTPSRGKLFLHPPLQLGVEGVWFCCFWPSADAFERHPEPSVLPVGC